MHMSLCGSHIFDYLKLCERCVHHYVCPCGNCDDGDELWMLCIRLGDKVTMWIFVISLWWWFESCCIYLIDWLNEITCDYNIARKWICVFIWCVILILCKSSYLLYVERISYPPVAFWSPKSLWCRRVGWGRLVGVSIRGRLGAYSPFYALILKSCLVGSD